LKIKNLVFNKINSSEILTPKLYEEYTKLIPVSKIGLQKLDKKIYNKALKE